MTVGMDSLSDLPGADHFAALLAREELRRSRTGERMVVAVIDVDGLRAVNGRHGAAAGTDLLRHCAAALRTTVRGVDEIARTGADDFSVLLHATDSRSANVWADRFENELERANAGASGRPDHVLDRDRRRDDGQTLLEVAGRARRRMEVVQTVRRRSVAIRAGRAHRVRSWNIIAALPTNGGSSHA